MGLSDSITRSPIPHDRATGDEARNRYAECGSDLAELAAGAAGCSSHLSTLLVSEEDWLKSVCDQDPDVTLAAILSGIGTEPSTTISLRQAKRRTGLLTALCDLGGLWSLEQVTGALTDLADRAVRTAITTLVAEEAARGKLPEIDAPDGGLFALAMGKMGARELNYSSDIDLILLFDEALYPAQDYADIRRVFIRVAQRLVRLLSDVSEGGYVFRTDLRLRPDPSVTPVVIGMGSAERYYESQGRTWERAAMIKARACAGDIKAGERFLADIAPFIWRRHLDFATIEEAHDMRQRIREHKGLGGPISLPGHDVKLGRGGIREIEFFTQTRQLICGGRDADLRQSQTKPALAALTAKGWVDAETRDFLSDAYTRHRTLEHRIQMLDDAQTHIYPASDDGRARIADFCGATDQAEFETRQKQRFQAVEKLTDTFFAPGQPKADPDAIWNQFPNPEAARQTVADWQRVPALRTERARGIFERLAPKLAESLRGAADPDQALAEFDRFMRGLPAGVQVLSLFEANPRILELLVDICAIAPRLAEYLGRNAGVLDAVLSRDFFQKFGEASCLVPELSARLEGQDSYEGVLDAARIWARELNFRAGVQLLRGISNPEEAAAAYSAIAEAVVATLLPHVVAEHTRRYGNPPGDGAAVLAMGKLGSGEMTAGSDLDLIVIYGAKADDLSDGRKPLAPTAYYARLTQALISALTAPTAQGTLYSVDMRLRPSGRQGPVATSLSSFASYQRTEAWTWEHLALTRARVIAGPPDLSLQLEQAIAAALAEPRDRAKILEDVRDMRRRLAEAGEKAARDPWELKLGPGRMLDIELVLQAGRVLHPEVTARSPRKMIGMLAEAEFLDTDQADHLRDSLSRLSAIQQISRLALGEGFDPERSGPGLTRLVCDMAGVNDLDALESKLAEDAKRSAGIVSGLLES